MEGELLDPGRLLPVIVPAGYFPSRVPACTPFLAGVDVAFGEDGDGVVGYTPPARLEAVGLSVRDAERIALENLCQRARQGDVSGRTMTGDDGQPAFILLGGGHWLSAPCLTTSSRHSSTSTNRRNRRCARLMVSGRRHRLRRL